MKSFIENIENAYCNNCVIEFVTCSCVECKKDFCPNCACNHTVEKGGYENHKIEKNEKYNKIIAEFELRGEYFYEEFLKTTLNWKSLDEKNIFQEESESDQDHVSNFSEQVEDQENNDLEDIEKYSFDEAKNCEQTSTADEKLVDGKKNFDEKCSIRDTIYDHKVADRNFTDIHYYEKLFADQLCEFDNDLIFSKASNGCNWQSKREIIENHYRIINENTNLDKMYIAYDENIDQFLENNLKSEKYAIDR